MLREGPSRCSWSQRNWLCFLKVSTQGFFFVTVDQATQTVDQFLCVNLTCLKLTFQSFILWNLFLPKPFEWRKSFNYLNELLDDTKTNTFEALRQTTTFSSRMKVWFGSQSKDGGGINTTSVSQNPVRGIGTNTWTWRANSPSPTRLFIHYETDWMFVNHCDD